MFDKYQNGFEKLFVPDMSGAMLAFGVFAIMLAVLFALAVYIYFASSWYTIARKLNHRNPWVAWIPIANLALILQLGGFHWAWIFLLLIPILGWIAFFVLFVIATWKVFDKRHYPGWFSLSLVIPQVGTILYLIALGFVAFADKRYTPIHKLKKLDSTKKKRR